MYLRDYIWEPQAHLEDLDDETLNSELMLKWNETLGTFRKDEWTLHVRGKRIIRARIWTAVRKILKLLL